MMHGPCGAGITNSPCYKDGKCSKYYPKKFQQTTIVDQDGYPVYRRRDNGYTIEKNGVPIDNRNVVPHNPQLLLKYHAHINMEWCNQSNSIKYLFKYINKGSDWISAVIVPNDDLTSPQPYSVDEIKQYIDCRYVAPSESAWRIFSYSIHGRKPAVERMFFHDKGQNSVYYRHYERITNVLLKPNVTESMFTSWMSANQMYPEARLLTYAKFVEKFVYVKKKRLWQPRQRGYTIGRLMWVPPTTGELYYLRMMLTITKGPTSYEDIKLVNGFQYLTYREACYAMGFLGDDREYIAAIREAYNWGSGISQNQGLTLTNEELQHLTLIEIEKHMQRNNKILRHFTCMPFPDGYVTSFLGNRLIYDERNYDPEEQDQIFKELSALMTDEQRGIFEQIMQAVDNQNEGLTKNMRLANQQTDANSEEIRKFSEWILKVGEGKIAEPNDGLADITIPEELLISNFENPIQAIVDSTYPTLLHNYTNGDFLRCRAVLASTIEVVDEINEYVLNLIPGEEKEYLSADSIDRSEANDNDPFEQITPEFLNSLHTSGLPNHSIKLKVGIPIMLLRNLDQSEGLCNGTRLTVTKLEDHVIAAKIITGKNIGQELYIPRMPMSPSQSP
ncbi:ATP-dependent DNA helicase RRM3 [Trifolium repens]|nr:ATP-dependent DNA helicase RRM3 [Trifolium repens]